MLKNVKRLIVFTLAILLVSGCASHKMKEAQETGFLRDYSQLKPGENEEAVLVYLKPGANFRAYDKIMIDPVEVWYSPDVEYKGIQPDQLKELTDYFHEAMVKAVSDAYPVVDQPGPGVLRLRAAITDVIPGKPVRGTLTSILPPGIVISTGVKMVKGTYGSVGQTAIEVELLDSRTYERLGAAVDRRAGTKAPFRGEWKDAKGAFDYWAQKLRQRLDVWHGIE